jgi:hypothetical protein
MVIALAYNPFTPYYCIHTRGGKDTPTPIRIRIKVAEGCCFFPPHDPLCVLLQPQQTLIMGRDILLDPSYEKVPTIITDFAMSQPQVSPYSLGGKRLHITKCRETLANTPTRTHYTGRRERTVV